MKPFSETSVIPFPVRAKARRRQETEFLPAALEIIEAPASPVGRAVAGTIIAFLCVAIVWAVVGKVDIVATAQGRVIPTGKSKVIQPFETGVVRTIRVKDGDAVKAGDVLIELDPTTDASDGKRLTFALTQDQLDIARLQALLAGRLADFRPPIEIDAGMAGVARSEMEAQTAEHQAKLDSLDRQIDQKQAEGREVKAAIAKIEASLPLVSEQRDIRSSLLKNQFGSRLLYLQIEQQVVESQHELDAQTERGQENEQALAALGRQKAEAEAEYRKGLLADLTKVEVQASEHREEIVKSAMKRELRTLRAPVDGTVQQLAAHTLGGVVTPAEQLLVIVPNGVALEIEANLANRDVGFVHRGQEVAIKIETFNFTRYGLLHGRVESLSQDAVSNQDGRSDDASMKKGGADMERDDNERQSRQPSYVAHIAVREKGIQTEQGFAELEPGMSVTAEIKTGQQTIMQFLLSPLERLRKDSFGER